MKQLTTLYLHVMIVCTALNLSYMYICNYLEHSGEIILGESADECSSENQDQGMYLQFISCCMG